MAECFVFGIRSDKEIGCRFILAVVALRNLNPWATNDLLSRFFLFQKRKFRAIVSLKLKVSISGLVALIRAPCKNLLQRIRLKDTVGQTT